MFGWRRRAKADERRVPAWVAGFAKGAAWGEFGAVDSYNKAAERYTTSDLVFMCVKRLGDMASDAQLVLYEKDAPRNRQTGLPVDEARIEPDAHPFYDLWQHPNPWDTRAEFLEAMVVTLLLSPLGSFIHLDDGERAAMTGRVKRVTLEKEPLALWWLLPEAIKVVPGRDSFIKEYIHEIAGDKTIFEPPAVMRVVEFNPINRYASVSRVQPANLASVSDIAGQKTNWAMFENGFRPSAIIQSDRDMISPDELKLMEKMWQQEHTGADNWHKFFPLWAGFKVAEYGMTPKDAEFTEASKLNRFRVFGTFGVHPGVVLSEDVNLANAKVAEHVTRAWTVKPLLRRISDEITGILDKWPDAPPAEAHFVNIVPEDEQIKAEIERLKAESAGNKALAISNLVQALGLEAGGQVAKMWELIGDEVMLPEMIGPEVKHYWSGWKNNGTIAPVLPQVPFESLRYTENDIQDLLDAFYDTFPQLTGILETGGNGTS